MRSPIHFVIFAFLFFQNVIALDLNYTLSVFPSGIGDFLVDRNGRTLYVFDRDCFDTCLDQFTPLVIANDSIATGSPVINASLIGIVTRKDLQKVVTYAGWVLFTYIEDVIPGSIHAQKENKYGGYWSLLFPNGTQNTNEYSARDLQVMSSDKYGEYLSNSRGMALYAFDLDRPEMPMCDAICSVKWPKLLISSNTLKVAPGVNASLVSSFPYEKQYMVEYNNYPLYVCSSDTIPGEVTGQAAKDNGGRWYMITSKGDLIKTGSSRRLTTMNSLSLVIIFIFIFILS